MAKGLWLVIADNLLVRQAKRINNKKRIKKGQRIYRDVFSSSSSCVSGSFKLINVLFFSLGSSVGPASSSFFFNLVYFHFFFSLFRVLANNNFQEKSTQTV